MSDYKTIKIDDNYINEMSEFFGTASENLQGMLDNYNTILNEVLQEAIISGENADKLQLFENAASSLEQGIKEIGAMAKQSATDYLADIDEADSYLY